MNAVPKFSNDDVVVVQRSGKNGCEVWANRSFKERTLVLAPDCTEWKDKYWTYGRSNVVKQTADLHPQGKCIGLDGRLRNNPTEARPFSLFFAVERNEDAS